MQGVKWRLPGVLSQLKAIAEAAKVLHADLLKRMSTTLPGVLPLPRPAPPPVPASHLDMTVGV